jgi:hypothetical protein
MNYAVTVTPQKSHIFMTCLLYFRIILTSSHNIRSDAILGSVHYLCCTCSCHILMKVGTQHEGLILTEILFTALTLFYCMCNMISNISFRKSDCIFSATSRSLIFFSQLLSWKKCLNIVTVLYLVQSFADFVVLLHYINEVHSFHSINIITC